MINRLKEILLSGDVALGASVSTNSLDTVEVMANLGFDWLVFDTEHTHLSIETVKALIQTTKGSKTVPIVRVAWNDMVLIKRALDIGAFGIIIPWVNNREEGIKAVRACKYPPAGVRGVGPSTHTLRRFGMNIQEYLSRADEEVMVIPQIETAEALNNVDEILSVKGVDAFIIGPADLSISMGIPLQYDHPRLVEAIDKILKAGKRANAPAGIFAPSIEIAIKLIKDGFQLVNIGGNESFLVNGAKDALRRVSSVIGKRD